MNTEYKNISNGTILDLNNKKLKENSMLTVNPHLWIEWDFLNNDIDIYKATKGSDKIVNWICKKCKEKYSKKIQIRDRGQGCPYCRGFKISNTNNLEYLRPDLMEFWDFEKNNKKPSEFTKGVNTKVWWKCEKCKDSYFMPINKKVNGRGCSICAGYVTTDKNSLGGLYPEIAKEWHPTKNENLTPYQVSKRSGKKVWWKCKDCKNDYQMTIDKKVDPLNIKKRCQVCNDGLSLGESLMYTFLFNNNINFQREKSFDWSNKKRYDFYLPDYNMIIEVHGEQHYNGSFSRMGGKNLKQEQFNDFNKQQMAFENGIFEYKELNFNKSTIENFKNQILKLNLLELLNIKEIDLKNLKVSNLAITCFDLHSKGNSNVEIQKITKLSSTTVKRYIKMIKQLNN